MSKSLNQAFIRAYSKEKASRPVPPPAVVSPQLNNHLSEQPNNHLSEQLNNHLSEQLREQLNGQLNELPNGQFGDAGLMDFVVRFDTATCGVPAPHMSVSNRSSDKPREGVAVAAGPSRSSGRPPARASAVSPATAAALPRPQDDAALRGAIAEQMNRAGEWDGSTASDFPGGFPMLSQHHQRTAPVRTVPLQTVPMQTQPGSPSARPIHATASPSTASQATRSQVTRSQITPSQVSPPQVSSPSSTSSSTPTPSPLSSTSPSISGSASQPNGSSSHSFLYASSGSVPGHGPAQTSSAGRSSTSSNAPERQAVAQDLSSQFSPRSPELPKREVFTPSLQSPALLSQHTKPGDFFRLDRPSYSPAHPAQVDHDFSDSGDSGSELLGLSASQVNLESSDTAASSESGGRSEARLREDASHAAKIERVQLVERELRHSKLRIFNPVWEVDSFQWPDICLELLEQRSEVLETVAKNLYEAVQEGLQVLAITSPQGGEGRTTVACCLAKLVGSRGLNVAIVDGDIDNPTLSYQTNLDIQQDWKSAILNQLPLEEIAVHSIDDQVTLVPLIGAIDDSELSVDDNRIEFMLHELSESFDLVIVDMGHMNSPRSLVGSLCARGAISAVVAVVDHRTSDAQEIDHCLRRIRQAGVASIGVVENFAA